MTWLKSAAGEVEHLQGVVVAQRHDSTVWHAWSAEGHTLEANVAYFCDMARAGQRAVGAADASGVRLSVETDGRVVFVEGSGARYLTILSFAPAVDRFLARAASRRLHATISHHLPEEGAADLCKAERVMAFLLRYAPDAHAAPMRLALQTGISLERLQTPAALTDSETSALEDAVRNLLGIEDLRV